MAYHALLIANNLYADPLLSQLEGAEKDAQELYDLFKRELGYQAQVLYGPSRDQVHEAVEELGRRVHAGDTVLFYFSGHGTESVDGQDQYLLLKQAKLHQLRGGYSTPAGVLSVNDLLRDTDDWPDVARVFVFDACRVRLGGAKSAAGAVPADTPQVFGSERVLNLLGSARGQVLRASRPKQGGAHAYAGASQPTTKETPRAWPPVLIKACLSNQEAREIKGLGRGIFSLALDEALQDAKNLKKAVLTEAGLLGQVRERVARMARQYGMLEDQTPWMNEGAPEVLLFLPPLDKARGTGLSELVDAFERQLAAGQLDWPDDDCCVTTLALMEPAGLGAAGLERYRQLLRQAREDKDRVPPPPPQPEPGLAVKGVLGLLVVVSLVVVPWIVPKGPEEKVAAPEPASAAALPKENSRATAPRPPADPYQVVDGLPRDHLQALQYEAAARAGVGVEFSDRLRDGQRGPKLMVIPAGQFQMGSHTGQDTEKPPHPRWIEAFALMKTEVTVGQYLACAKVGMKAGGCELPVWMKQNLYNISYNYTSHNLYRQHKEVVSKDDSPVVGVTWDMARQYARWLTSQTGKEYRLPSESEWEFAAKSGSTTPWSFGDDEGKLGQYAWFAGNSQGRFSAVGRLLPNAWGLHDMHGNVMEWVQDCWHESYVFGPETGAAWETGCKDSRRVIRGGAWKHSPVVLRSTFRTWGIFEHSDELGFRLARAL